MFWWLSGILNLLLRFNRVCMNMMWWVVFVIVSWVMNGFMMCVIILKRVSFGRCLSWNSDLFCWLMKLIKLILNFWMIFFKNLIRWNFMFMKLVKLLVLRFVWLWLLFWIMKKNCLMCFCVVVFFIIFGFLILIFCVKLLRCIILVLRIVCWLLCWFNFMKFVKFLVLRKNC